MGSLLFNNTSRGHLRNIMRIIERSDVDLLRFPTFLMSKKISMSSMKDTVTCQEPLSQAPPSPKPVAHIPVMAREVLEYLAPRDNAVILDTTFGAGGHSRKILESCPGVRLMCLDRDPVAYKYAEELQREYPNRVFPLLGKFSELPLLLAKLQLKRDTIDGVLMDLGVSSMQFDTPERGFMLSQDGPLDMRMDNNRDPNQLTAADILSHIDEDSLYKVLKYYGEESNARKISRVVVESRHLFRKLHTTKELAELVMSVTGEDGRLDKLKRYSHPATKTFQALRILVNNELNELDYGLRLAHYYLKARGVLVALSFHSLEDTVVKRHITGVDIDKTSATIGLGVTKHRSALSTYSPREMDVLMAKKWESLTKHVVLPSEEEVKSNPRARSAKLRAAVKA
ncbi:probable methyltransferase-like protein 15 homolog [Homarus americanus]|uniref:probable methyltransferase-like protein 15 homolog n=1 Tax=Homarus americanus TaxID=6706 RepID=UPI001C48A6DE|nr:probable methyltransferase-like protein 15 homolog [Homarus americanus]